jgi:hypothetical protein
MRNQNKGGPSAPGRPSLSERQNQKYSFPTEKVEDLFMGLRELKFIEYPKPNKPEEASKFYEPNFCNYHHILGQTFKDCLVVKELIQKLIDEGTIDANLLKSMKKEKKVATSNGAIFENDFTIRNNKLSASMKARLSFAGSTTQDVGHPSLEGQESINSSSQDDMLYND